MTSMVHLNKNYLKTTGAVLLFLLFTLNCKDQNMSLKVGDYAPNFELPDENGNIRKEDERWSVDFSGMTADQAYEAYLIALRERCSTMAQAMQMSGLSDTTLRRHFKEHDIRQYNGQ